MIKYSFKKFSADDLDGFVSLSSSEYPKSNPTTNKEKMRWKHLNNPIQASFIHQILDHKKCVGRLMYENKLLWIARKKFKVWNPSDLLIHKSYRTPFSNFLKLIYGPKKQIKDRFVIHTANENSFRLYLDVLKLPHLFSLAGYFFPINPFSVFKKTKRGRPLGLYFILKLFITFISKLIKPNKIQFIKGDINDTEIAYITRFYHRNKVPFFDRTEKNVKWRQSIYNKVDINSYKVYLNNELLCFFTLLNTKYKKYDTAIILDFMATPNINFYHKFIIRLYVIYKAIYFNNDIIFFMANSNSPLSEAFCGFPFFKLSDKLLPHPSPFFVRQCKIQNSIFRRTHVTLHDIDYF